MPILKVSFALLVILANKILDLIIFDDKVLPIDLLLPKLEDFFLKRINFCLFRIKWRSVNTYYNILKLFISRASEFNFDIRRDVLFSQRLIGKRRPSLGPSDKKQQSFNEVVPLVITRKANSDWC